MKDLTYVRALCCLLAISVVPLFSVGQIAQESTSPQYVRELWSTGRGFPGGTVHTITQTSDGFLWIGTDQGLTQFDGESFKTTPASKFAPTPLAPVFGLLTDGLGEVWIKVGGNKLFRYSPGRLDDVLWLLHGEDAVTAMCTTKDGSVLLTALVSGIVRYHEGRFDVLIPANRLPRSPITSIIEAKDGRLWFGTQEQGIFYVQDGQVFPLRNGLPSKKITSLIGVGDDIWIGTEQGVARWDGTSMTTEGVPAQLRRERVFAMLMDRRSNLWMGTGDGLFRIEKAGQASPNRIAQLENTSVTALFEDRDGNLWVGQAGMGIARVQESRFTTYGRNNGLPSEGIGPVYVDSENRVWFALSDGGLYLLTDGVVRAVSVPGLGNRDVVYSIAGNGDDLWIGSLLDGLAHLQILSAAKVRTAPGGSLTQKNGLAQNSVFAVHQARDGAIWAGTLNGGVSEWKNGRLNNFSVANGLPSNAVSAITETADGTIWVATLRGLSAWFGERWRSYGVSDGLPSETVNCLLEDSHGTLWIGTTEGLAFFKEGAIHAAADAPPSLRGSVLGLADDHRGSLWVVMSTGVIQVSRQKLQDGELVATDTREFGLADGLPSVTGVRRDRSIVADQNGRIWIATSHGLSFVDPAGLERRSSPTLTRIESVSADGSLVASADVAHIPAGSRRVTISYAGLNLSAPERVRFRYKLDSFDQDWSDPTRQRETVYTNLPPGSYRFHLIASDQEGRWTDSESSLALVIQPLLWQTLWFRIGAGLTLACVAIGIYQFRVRHMAQRLNVGFEERLAERTRIARDLHDTLLQGLLSASMQLSVADEKLASDSPAKPLVGRVLNLMSTVSQEGRNVVNGLRSSNQSGDDLEMAFSRIRQELSIPDRVNFRIVVEGRRRRLNPAIRDEVYWIGREALVNAFRHSAADLVEVKLAYEPSVLRLLFSDNGKGIDHELVRGGRDGHWGLSGMRERADRMGATLKLSSRLNAGTEVELSISEQIAFLSPTGRRRNWIPRFKSAISSKTGSGRKGENESSNSHWG